ncbi:DUF222 domain-containing protein [Geodermatophilus sp. SYSU D00758]
MFTGGGFGVGLTVTDLPVAAAVSGVLVAEERPARLAEVLPVDARTAAEKAFELQRVQALKARLAAYEVELVAALAADRPAVHDRRAGAPGAAGPDPGPAGVPGPPEGVSEFFCDELAVILNCSRTAASVLTDEALTLTERLPGTRAALADGRLDWPRARAIARELGWPARATDPRIVEQVEAAVLPHADGWSVSRLRAAVRRELLARDADAADRRRKDAERAADVTNRPAGDGMGDLVARMPWPLARAARATLDAHARAAQAAGDARPLGQLRVAALADLVLRPWAVAAEPVAVHLQLTAPLDALTPQRFLAGGAPPPADTGTITLPPPGAVAAPTAAVDGEPITAAHLRALLTQVDSLCPGGLQPPTGGSLTFALTDPDGTLRAVLDRPRLERLAARGCPAHGRDADCRCAVLDRPAATGAYRPTDAQRLFVRTRDRTCRHPGCANRAGWADLDHVVPHACGGATACDNLCCLCRRHHRLKTHAPGWTHTLTPDGRLTVTTPSGVTRTTRPPGQTEAPPPPVDLPLTGIRLLATCPEPPPETPDPADDPPPF